MPALFAHSARDIELQISQIEKKKIQNAGFRVKETFTFYGFYQTKDHPFANKLKKKKKKDEMPTLIKRRREKKKLFERAVEPGPYGTLRERGKKSKKSERERERESRVGWD